MTGRFLRTAALCGAYMRRLRNGLLAAAMLVGAACDVHSPTAPVSPQREYTGGFTVQDAGREVRVHYDQTWGSETRLRALRAFVDDGFRSGTSLLDYQLGRPPTYQLSIDLFVEGDLRQMDVPFSTLTPNGVYAGGIAVCSEYGEVAATIPDCVAHQLQHGMADAIGTANWRDALHTEPVAASPIERAYTILGHLTDDPRVLAAAVHPSQCDTD